MQPLKLSALPLALILLFLSPASTASSDTVLASPQPTYSNSTVKIPTLRREVMKAEITYQSGGIISCPASGCTKSSTKSSQATKSNNGSAGTLPAVVVGLCIAGGVAAIAGGLGMGMGLDEEEVGKKEEAKKRGGEEEEQKEKS